MATNKNITMKQFNGVDYDTLYPKTIAAQIDDVYSKDEMSNLFLPKAGGSMGGILDMNENRITNLPTPTSSSEPATKGYVDGNAFVSKKAKLFDLTITPSNKNPSAILPLITQISDTLLPSGILYKIKMNNCKSSESNDKLSIKYSYFIRGSEVFGEKVLTNSLYRTDYASNNSIVIFDPVDNFGGEFFTNNGDTCVSLLNFKSAIPAGQYNEINYIVVFNGSNVHATMPYINQGSIRVEAYLVYVNA